MGNHAVGQAMAAVAKAALEAHQEGAATMTTGEALRVLDALAEPWRGSDAEFDGFEGMDELVALISAAFDAEPPGGPSADDPDEDDYEDWYEEVYEQFSRRYGFW